MYVSILHIKDSWQLYSPDLGMITKIEADDYYNRTLDKYLEGRPVRKMPEGKFLVISDTKQFIRINKYSIDDFVECVPVDFRLTEKGYIEVSDAHKEGNTQP
jgi:hypothetical protein